MTNKERNKGLLARLNQAIAKLSKPYSSDELLSLASEFGGEDDIFSQLTPEERRKVLGTICSAMADASDIVEGLNENKPGDAKLE